MAVWPEMKDWNGVLLPDQTKNDLKPDIGTVVSFGHALGERPELVPGDRVVLKSQSGKCVVGFDSGSWSTDLEVRMYGRAGGMTFKEYGDALVAPMDVPWWRCALALLGEGESLTPIGRNTLVVFDAAQTESGGVMLLSEPVPSVGEVVSVGVGVSDSVNVGKRYFVHEGDVTFVGPRLGIVPEDGLYCEVD